MVSLHRLPRLKTLASTGIAAVPVSGMTQQFNNLGLTLSASGNATLTGWVAGARYLIFATVSSSNSASGNSNYFSATSTNNIVATQITSGQGVVAYLNRGTIGTTDAPPVASFGNWTPAASTTPLYLYVYSTAAATITTQLYIILQ